MDRTKQSRQPVASSSCPPGWEAGALLAATTLAQAARRPAMGVAVTPWVSASSNSGPVRHHGCCIAPCPPTDGESARCSSAHFAHCPFFFFPFLSFSSPSFPVRIAGQGERHIPITSHACACLKLPRVRVSSSLETGTAGCVYASGAVLAKSWLPALKKDTRLSRCTAAAAVFLQHLMQAVVVVVIAVVAAAFVVYLLCFCWMQTRSLRRISVWLADGDTAGQDDDMDWGGRTGKRPRSGPGGRLLWRSDELGRSEESTLTRKKQTKTNSRKGKQYTRFFFNSNVKKGKKKTISTPKTKCGKKNQKKGKERRASLRSKPPRERTGRRGIGLVHVVTVEGWMDGWMDGWMKMNRTKEEGRKKKTK